MYIISDLVVGLVAETTVSRAVEANTMPHPTQCRVILSTPWCTCMPRELAEQVAVTGVPTVETTIRYSPSRPKTGGVINLWSTTRQFQTVVPFMFHYKAEVYEFLGTYIKHLLIVRQLFSLIFEHCCAGY